MAPASRFANSRAASIVACCGFIAWYALAVTSAALAQGGPLGGSGLVFDGIVKLDFGKSNNKTTSAISSAFMVEHDGGLYLVTAFHNIHGASNCTVSTALHDRGKQPLFGPSAQLHRTMGIVDKIFVDVASDLAIIKVENSDIFGIKMIPLELCKEGLASQVPLGSSAAAFATPSRRSTSGGSELRSAVAYHCTVSRDGTLDGMLNADGVLRSDYTSFLNLPHGVQTEAAKTISLRAKTFTHFLLVETVSITAGFSGTAIVVSTDGYQKPAAARVAGVVLGGNPSDSSQGRWVLATSYKSIAEGVLCLEGALSGKRKLREDLGQYLIAMEDFPKISSNLPRSILSDGHAADWIVTVSPDNVERSRWMDTIGDDPANPLGTAPEREPRLPNNIRLIDGRLSICGDAFIKQLNSEYPGCEIHFHKCDFEIGCLNRAILLRAVFDDCHFKDTQFTGSVLSGCTFLDNCRFTQLSYGALSNSWSHGVRYPSKPLFLP